MTREGPRPLAGDATKLDVTNGYLRKKEKTAVDNSADILNQDDSISEKNEDSKVVTNQLLLIYLLKI